MRAVDFWNIPVTSGFCGFPLTWGPDCEIWFYFKTFKQCHIFSSFLIANQRSQSWHGYARRLGRLPPVSAFFLHTHPIFWSYYDSVITHCKLYGKNKWVFFKLNHTMALIVGFTHYLSLLWVFFLNLPYSNKTAYLRSDTHTTTNCSFIKTTYRQITGNRFFINNSYVNFYTCFDLGKNILTFPERVHKHPVYYVRSIQFI